MPCMLPLTGAGLRDKAAALARLLPSCLAAAALLCLVLLASRRTALEAADLARDGLKAFVISGNLGHADPAARFRQPPAEIERDIAAFIAAVRAA